MFETTGTQDLRVASMNAQIGNIKERMGICPYYGTYEVLDEVLIQKESWGGKRVPENLVKLSPSANFAYTNWATRNGVEVKQPHNYYLELFEKFLEAPKEKYTEKKVLQLALQHLVSLRIAFLDAKKSMGLRIGIKGKELDNYFPIDAVEKVKLLEKFRMENEPLLDEVQSDGLSWQNLIGYATAGMGYVQKTVIESQIEALVENYPVWRDFGKHIQGFGAYTCGFLIACIGDPRRFADSGKLRGYAGVAIKDGQPQRQKRGESGGYSPKMKAMLMKVFPESFRKIAGKFPNEPYAIFLAECFEKEKAKAINASDDYIRKTFAERGETVLDIVNLGFEERETEKGSGIFRKVFLGYKVKTDKSAGKEPTTEDDFVKEEDKIDKGGYRHFLNPGHVQQRALRRFGSMFLSDFYHYFLYSIGENPDIARNPRIMAVLEMVAKGKN